MNRTEANNWRARIVSDPLAAAFVFSLLFHLFVFSGIYTARKLGWTAPPLPARLSSLFQKPKPIPTVEILPMDQAPQVPHIFVEVDPTLAATEAPKETKYYAVANTRAANPDSRIQSSVPKIDGRQENIARTFDAARPEPQPLQPAPPPPQPAPAQESRAQPLQPAPPKPENLAARQPDEGLGPRTAPAPNTGPSTQAQPEQPETPREKPRRLADVRPQDSAIAGLTMKQDGGVQQRGRVSLDARATPFASYDQRLIAAIQNRWYDLLAQRDFASDRSGKVVLEFRLHYDGRISNMVVTTSTVGDLLSLLCQRAVTDPAPFESWPSDMRRMVGANYRDVRFTFYYN